MSSVFSPADADHLRIGQTWAVYNRPMSDRGSILTELVTLIKPVPKMGGDDYAGTEWLVWKVLVTSPVSGQTYVRSIHRFPRPFERSYLKRLA